jgi:TPP-dependent pyruvate/acetoin dehydrogenase alpha subunit
LAYYEVRDWIKDLGVEPRKEADLSGYGGLEKDALERMYRSMVLARRIELEEKILLRKGHAKFFIGCGGKELIDVVAA